MALRDQGRLDYLSQILTPVIQPIGGVLRSTLDGIGLNFQSFANSKAIMAENARLRSQAQTYAQYAEIIDNYERRLDALRRLNRMQSIPAKRKITADVVSYDVRQNRVQIVFAGGAPVKVGDAVINGDGLIGRVESLGNGRAFVLLASSPAFRIGAMVMSNPPVAGLIRGSTQNQMTLGNAENSGHIKPGDQVTTSTFSETIPPYIPIGRIEQRLSQPEFGIEEFRVRLNVQLSVVREVLVVGQ